MDDTPDIFTLTKSSYVIDLKAGFNQQLLVEKPLMAARRVHSPLSAIECENRMDAAESSLFRQQAVLIAQYNSVEPSEPLYSLSSPPPLPLRKDKIKSMPLDPALLLDVDEKRVKKHHAQKHRKRHRKKSSQVIPPEPEKVTVPPGIEEKPVHAVIEMPEATDDEHYQQPPSELDEMPEKPPVSRHATDNTIRQRVGRHRMIKDINRSEDRRMSLISLRNTRPISLEFKNMAFSIWEGRGKKRREKKILKGISGCFEGRELHCIMGPSGSGKTTLLNTLAGFNVKAAKCLMVRVGTYRLEASKVFSGGNKCFCYITQDIELPPFLTVKETMAFATRLKMPHMPHGLTLDKFVDSLIGPLGLRSSMDTFVNYLSGGQRKRLAIATELINYPPVLFADEPTSGLDSAMAEECIDLFRQMANKGCNIITTIHQPSAKVFSNFNTLYCISRGECIYEGPTGDVLTRLSSIGLTPPPFYSPADFILDIALGEATEEKLIELIDNNKHQQYKRRKEMQLEALTDDEIPALSGSGKRKKAENNVSEPASSKLDQLGLSFSRSNASFWKQTAALSERVLKTTCRNHMLFLFRISGLIAIGLLMGGVFWRDSKTSTPQILAILSSSLFTSSFMPAVMGVPLDVKFMTTEYLNSWYQIPALAISTTLTDCVLEIAHPILFTVILWKMADLRDDDIRMLRSSLISILSAWNGRSVGLVAGSFTSRLTSAYVAFGGMAPFFVFTGSVLPYNLAPTYLTWLFYGNSCFYVFEAHLQQVYGGGYLKPGFNSSNCLNPISVDCIEERQNYDGKFIIEQAFGFKDEEANFYKDLSILIAFFIGFRIIGAFTLFWRLKRELKRANNR